MGSLCSILQTRERDFLDTAQEGMESIRINIENMKNIVKANENTTKANDIKRQSEKENKNIVSQESEDFENIKEEFLKINETMFQSLEIQSKSVGRTLLQMNNTIDQHNLQLMPYLCLQQRLKERINKKDK